jgi:hypothetical protein
VSSSRTSAEGFHVQPWVPALVAGGILVGGAIDYARKEIHLERAFLPLVNGWYVFGPVAVLSAAGEAPPALASVPPLHRRATPSSPEA